MSETAPKAAPKKRAPAKKPPTKAQALKALGLSQADLDVLKQVADARASAQPPVDFVPPTATPAPTNPDRPLPRDDDFALDSGDFEQDQAKAIQLRRARQKYYIRNARGVEVGFRLSRQAGKGVNDRVNLKPRGQRGDIADLQPEDLDDHALIQQQEYGIIEIITADEARKVMGQQAINQQAAGNPLHDVLRSETGASYTSDQIKTDTEFNEQGIVVANTNAEGQIVTDRRGNIVRPGEEAAAADQRPATVQRSQASLGGNPAILSDGFAAMQAGNEAAMRADAAARAKGSEGIEAGLGGARIVR